MASPKCAAKKASFRGVNSRVWGESDRPFVEVGSGVGGWCRGIRGGRGWEHEASPQIGCRKG